MSNAQPESRLRARARMWCGHALPPGYEFAAIEHGRKHAGTDQQRAAEWARLKSQGVQAGHEDACITGPGRLYLAVEFKAGTKMSPAQNARRDHLLACGHQHIECRSIVQLAAFLASIGVPVSQIEMERAAAYDRELAAPEPGKNRASKPATAKPDARTIRKVNALRSQVMF